MVENAYAEVGSRRLAEEIEAAREEVCANCRREPCTEAFHTGCALNEFFARLDEFLRRA